MFNIRIDGQSLPIDDVGFQTYWSILCPTSLIAFSVPSNELNELLSSSEWVAFQNLLEKYQKEDIQKRLQTEKEIQESLSCTEYSDQSSHYQLVSYNKKRIVDILRNLVRFR